MSTEYETDEYENDIDESSINVSLNDIELHYNIPINYSVTNDSTASQFFQTMQKNLGNHFLFCGTDKRKNQL